MVLLYRRPNSRFWWFQVKHHGRIYRRSTERTDKAGAAAVERDFRKSLPKHKPSKHSFSAAGLRWLEEKAHKRSLHSDAGILDWFNPRIGDYLLSEITRDVVERLRREKGEDCSTETVNRHMALLRAILRKARDDWEWVEKIPKVPMHPRPDREPRFLTWPEFLRLVCALPSHQRGPAWFAVSTGLRATPILSLRWSWISRDGARFPPYVMKGGKWLTIPLSQTAWHVLAEQWGSHEEFVFTYRGRPIGEKFTTAAWRKATERAGLSGVRFHDLRHSWASWHAQNGTPAEALQKLGGWSTHEAMRIYAHHSPASLGEWADNAEKAHTRAHTRKDAS